MILIWREIGEGLLPVSQKLGSSLLKQASERQISSLRWAPGAAFRNLWKPDPPWLCHGWDLVRRLPAIYSSLYFLNPCPYLPPFTRLFCPWDSPGKNTGVGCHALLWGIFLTQGLNLHLLWPLHCRRILTPELQRTWTQSHPF